MVYVEALANHPSHPTTTTGHPARALPALVLRRTGLPGRQTASEARPVFACVCMVPLRRQPSDGRHIAGSSHMAYWRVIIKGSLGAVEKWSTSLAFGIVGLAPDTADQATTDAMMNGIKAVTTTSNVGSALMGLLGISGNIEAVRVERRAED
jgi:hypothetical protein